MSIFKKYVFVFACIALSVKSWAQAPSPFTTFGIGDPYGSATATTHGMAGVGVSQPQFWFLNNQNPALLVYNNLTVFQAGLVAESKTIKADSLSEKTSGGNMNYLVTAFPVLPGRWSTSLGLMPMTSVNYKVSYTKEIQGSPARATVAEEGSGGLTQLYWSNGVRINSEWAVGAKISYVFSSIVNTSRTRLPSTVSPINFPIAMEEQTYVRDFMFGLGVSYSRDSLWSKNYRLSFGAVGNLPASLNATRTTQFYRSTPVGEVIEGDTLSDTRSSLKVPASLTFGVSLSRGARWDVGTEFTYQDWSSFNGSDAEQDNLGTSWRWGLGGEITPDPVAVENFLKRMTYRLGVNYERLPYLPPPNGNPVYDYGATFGLSVPAGRSSLDVAVKLGKRGNSKDNGLEESYFRVFFGITFNDQWFIKRKFD
jgi:long-subunit fatty acid transport protein